MTSSYHHWDDEKTLNRMFGNQESVLTMVEAFIAQYPKGMKILNQDKPSTTDLLRELHTLRSLLGIFNADKGHAMAVAMDRSIRADNPVSPLELQQLADELRAFVAELEHYLSVQKS